MINQIILLDVDGVLAEFVDHMLPWMGATFRREDICQPDMTVYMDDFQKDRFLRIMDGPEFWRSQPVIEGAQAALESLKSEGHQLVAVTKPHASCAHWTRLRKAWLDEHFPKMFDGFVPTGDKHYVHGRVLVEDTHANLHSWSTFVRNAGRRGVIFDQPWNQGHDDYRRLRGWSSVKGIHSLLTDVQQLHEDKMATLERCCQLGPITRADFANAHGISYMKALNALERLVNIKWLVSTYELSEHQPGVRPRLTYRITDLGYRELARKEMKEMVNA